VSPSTLAVYRRALGIPADATDEQALDAIRAIAATRSPNFLHHTTRAPCTERKATMANPPPIDRRTHPTTALDARRRAHIALAVDWRNQPALSGEIADRICAMAQTGDLAEFIGSISEADLAELYRRMSLSPRTRRAAEVLYAACDLRAMAQRFAAPLAHVPPPAPAAPALPTAGKLTAREREYCREFGTSEATYLRLRAERDARNAKADAARLARRRAEREAMSVAAAALRGRQ